MDSLNAAHHGTNWATVFPDRFLPTPGMIKKYPAGPYVPPPVPEPNMSAKWMSLTKNLALQFLTVPG